MSGARRRSGPSDITPYIGVIALATVCVLVGGVWAACALAHAISDTPMPPRNPFALVIELAFGERPWPGTITTVIAGGELLVVLAVTQLGWWVFSRRRRANVDTASRHLASRRDLTRFGKQGVAETAERLGAGTDAPGVLIGRVIGTGQHLYGSWEDMHVDIWGTRTGKTTSRAIPAILDAPGAAVVTSNKRDIVDATRGLREECGTVWIFDPQKVAGAEPTWWWNPLTYVTDVDKAARLAGVFAAYSREAGAKTDSYFDPEGEALLGFLLLAAAEAHEPITTVYLWSSDPTDAAPVDVLRRAGHELPAEAVQGVINYPDKQRGGIYGSAKKSINCLVNPTITRWVTPPADDAERPEFAPTDFVTSRDTLYSLSREGQGTAGPLVTALTVATIEAAEEHATRSPGGRLTVPMLGVLDEAANVCRWRDLPNLYSHYGSRGIVLMTILQSWSQGMEVWGEHGMKKLWDAANIRVYGGGSTDDRFLAGLAELVGHYEMDTTSLSAQSGGHMGRSHTTSTSTRREKILEVSDLAALPRGRAIVLPSGAPPALIETLPWHRGPHAESVKASLAAYAPPDDSSARGTTGRGHLTWT